MSSESLEEMARALVEEMIANTENRLNTVEFVSKSTFHHHHHHHYSHHRHDHHRHHNHDCLDHRGVRDVVFCESFLEFVHRHPLLERAIISRCHDQGDDVDEESAGDNDGDDDGDDHHQNDSDSEKQLDCGGPSLSSCPFSLTGFSLQKGEKKIQEFCLFRKVKKA